MRAAFDKNAEFATGRRYLSSPFPLVDITVVPDDEIVQHRRIALLELMQKHIRQRAEALRIARTMLADGMALDTVLRITGLLEADITVNNH
ncbi:hypothetical protein SB6421_03740 [Klebsiella huaxiensis]|nr:hypothetical protein SB6421_03740 [Klebsiella huaxiensis]